MAFYPDFQCTRRLVQLILTSRRKPNTNTMSAMKECAHVLRQVLNSPQHPIVKTWCLEIIKIVSSCMVSCLKVYVSKKPTATSLLREPVEETAVENEERINDDYLELQDQIVCGLLPCTKEDAAQLAGIQVCIEENWPKNKRTQTFRRHLLRGQIGRIRELAQKIMVTPWEVDQTLYCAPPTQRDSETLTLAKKKDSPALPERSRTAKFMKCFDDPGSLISLELQEQCLPVEYRCDRRTLRLVQDRKRKLFHSQIYEDELGMKKLYIQLVSAEKFNN
ncbi:unnamed protein product [Gongylonema pulchrum]|uniref:RYDR_ITPR domain-containing protein n=1 Tax=Gongylonema pulchrum TaxID=637853 RepID=A0A183CY85_9BILA|nr:unnamed protein product [Gongylonema pulchrum]